MTAARRRAVALLVAMVAAAPPLAVACSRRTEIAAEHVDSGDLGTPTLDAGHLPEVDAGLHTYPECSERPWGPCQGPVDFPCDFIAWVNETAERCQAETGCLTNGWLEVAMDDQGCVTAIGMDQPNDAILACLAAELGTTSCPCEAASTKYFFGLDNSGCATSCSNEFPCDPPLDCVDGLCAEPE